MHTQGVRKPPSASPPVQNYQQQQPRGPVPYPRGQTPPLTQYRPPIPPEEIPRFQLYQSQQQQFPQGFPQGQSPHDMNTNVQQGGQGGSSIQMYNHAHLQRPAPTPAFIQPRATVSQSIRPQPRQPINMTSGNPGQPIGYNQQTGQTTTMFMTPNPQQFITHGQAQFMSGSQPQPVIIQSQNMPFPRQSFVGQYTINTSQSGGQFSQAQNPQQSYFQPQSTMYYNQSAPRMPVSQQPQQISQQSSQYQRRERKVIQITDPNTGKDVTEDIIPGGNVQKSTPASGSSSSRATPISDTATPPQGNDIAAQFAAQVAATLTPKQQEQQLAELAAQSEKAKQAQIDNSSSVDGDEEKAEASKPETEISVETVSQPTNPPQKIVEKSETNSKPSQNSEVEGEAKVSSKSEEEKVVIQNEDKNIKEQTPEKTEEINHGSAKKEMPISDSKSEVDSTVKIETKGNESKITKQDELPVIEKDKEASQKDAEKEKPVAVPVVKIDAEVEDTDEGKDGKKKTRKQKMKELNQKGESKVGSDMDAFVSEKEAVPESEGPKKVEEATTVQTAEVQSNIEKPPVEQKVEIKVEDEKVEEENVKNEEMSRDENLEKKNEKKPTLQYTYKEEQWSPLNPEGKKHYDRGFLLQFQFTQNCLDKPEGLPKLPDVILDKPLPNAPRGQLGGSVPKGGVPDFTPGFIRQAGGPSVGKRNSATRGGRGNNENKRVIHVQLMQDVKLHQTENAWKPNDKTENENEDLFKKVRGILNKLTPQKFQTLVEKVLDLNIDTEEKLKGTINLVFEKAIDEPSFSVAYANMCKCMSSIKVPKEKNQKDAVTFRKILLNRCQTEFEKDKVDEIDSARRQEEIDKAPDDKKKQLIEEKLIAEGKAKRRSLGNIRFIGELFKLKMLTEAIMHDCLLKLLKSSDEDSLECLCRLLTTIGKDIDSEKAKPRMDQYFNQIDKIVKQKKTTSRVRFMLQDVIDLRLSNWVPRRADNNPKTIDQIHKEVQKEDHERAILLSTVQVPTSNRRGGRGGRSGSHTPGDDGWQSVASKTQRNTLDPTKMRLTKHDVDDNIKLGPGGRPGYAAWGRGSSGGQNKQQNSADGDRTNTPANRFSPLSGGENYDSRNRMGRGLAPGHDAKNVGQQLAPGRGKHSGRSSQDRDAALAAVRGIVGGRGSRTPGGSREQSRDSSRNRDFPKEQEAKKPTPDAKELSAAEIEKKTVAIMDEYLHLKDIKEASECIQELQSPNMMHAVISASVNHVLERSSPARYHTGVLHRELVKQKLLSIESYSKGLGEVLEFAEDMAIDIPKIWQYLGELISPLVEERAVPMEVLRNICQPLIAVNKAGILVAEVLHDASKRMGHKKIGDLWKTSNLQWAEFLQQNESVDEFIKKNKLEYTISSDVPKSPDGKSMSTEQIQKKLDELIIAKNASNEVVFDWIEENVGEPLCKDPAFVRALMTSVCSSAITGSSSNAKVDPVKIQQRTILSQKILDHTPLLELQTLYALQALVHKLEHPPGVLRTFFDTLYDEDIISEDAFNTWESSSDPAEQVGKGVAKASVVQFFTWLREAEDDDQEHV